MFTIILNEHNTPIMVVSFLGIGFAREQTTNTKPYPEKLQQGHAFYRAPSKCARVGHITQPEERQVVGRHRYERDQVAGVGGDNNDAEVPETDHDESGRQRCRKRNSTWNQQTPTIVHRITK